MLVPQRQELRPAVGEVGVTDVDRRCERPFPFLEVAVEFDRLGRPRDEAGSLASN